MLAFAFVISGCATINSLTQRISGPGAPEGTQGYVTGFLGGAVADEPQAALAARVVLSAGGTAADAAVAAGFTLAVTLPSRAGLGGGGACLAYSPTDPSKSAFAFMFVPPAASVSGRADRPAAVPMVARGLYALHARYGRQPFETLVIPAEQLARFGAQVSRAFLRDLEVVGSALAADPATGDIFMPGGRIPAEGNLLLQTDLAATLSQLRTAGVGDLYQGTLARRLVEASVRAGGPIQLDDLRAALPRVVDPIRLPSPPRDTVAFLPPPADGGLAAAAAFRVLSADPNAADAAAAARASGVAARWRQGLYGGNVQAALDSPDSAPGSLPALPASTSLLTLDREGNAVACVLTMNNLFGTGRVAPLTGILLAASPNSVPPPLLSAALAYNASGSFHGMVAGTGQSGAPLATALGLAQSLAARRVLPTVVPEPGRANGIFCSGYLPGSERTCAWMVDPRSSGLAVGSN